MDDRVINTTERTMVDALGTCDVDHNGAFIQGRKRVALHSSLLSILVNLLDIEEIFKETIVQEATAFESLAILALAVARDTAAIASIAPNADMIVMQEDGNSVNDPIITLLSLLQPDSKSSLNGTPKSS